MQKNHKGRVGWHRAHGCMAPDMCTKEIACEVSQAGEAEAAQELEPKKNKKKKKKDKGLGKDTGALSE